MIDKWQPKRAFVNFVIDFWDKIINLFQNGKFKVLNSHISKHSRCKISYVIQNENHRVDLTKRLVLKCWISKLLYFRNLILREFVRMGKLCQSCNRGEIDGLHLIKFWYTNKIHIHAFFSQMYEVDWDTQRIYPDTQK